MRTHSRRIRMSKSAALGYSCVHACTRMPVKTRTHAHKSINNVDLTLPSSPPPRLHPLWRAASSPPTHTRMPTHSLIYCRQHNKKEAREGTWHPQAWEAQLLRCKVPEAKNLIVIIICTFHFSQGEEVSHFFLQQQ